MVLTKSRLGLSIKCVRKIFRKTNISSPLSAYQGARNVSFSEDFALETLVFRTILLMYLVDDSLSISKV